MSERRFWTDRANVAGTSEVSGGAGLADRPLRISAGLYAEMIAHVRRELPNEGCGLIAFDGDQPVKLYPGTNTLASRTRFRMDDAEVLRAVDEMDARGWRLGAIFHSHPASGATPSITDLDEANWPDALMMIVSFSDDAPEVRAFRMSGDAYQEVMILVDPEPPRLLERIKDVMRRYSPWRAEVLRPAALPLTGGAETLDAFEPAARPTIGILGGMGPLATGDLYLKIVEETPAETDQDHFPIVVYADPRVPDRSAALLGRGEDPTPWLIRGARRLVEMGADFIVIPCNTAHAFLDQIQPAIDVPILSMIEASADAIRATYPDARRVGLLATDGTIQSGIYQEALRARGIETVVPDDERQQHLVMPAIRAVKANNRHHSVAARLVEAAESLEERGAHVILAACTEIPVVLTAGDLDLPLVDATAALARRAVRQAEMLATGGATTSGLVAVTTTGVEST